MKRIFSFLLATFVLYPFSVFSQSTFTQVYQLFQAKCSGSGCHDGSDATFNVSVPEADLYDALVNVNPQNTTAATKGDKLVTPGYTERSFLLRKIAYGISTPLVIDLQHEGSYMPDTANRLADKEIELVRQWILWGAKETGMTVDTALINAYYGGQGLEDTYPNHEPPAPSEGFQMYVGKILVPTGSEQYYFFKFNPRLPANMEVSRIVTLMPAVAHHFIIYRFFPGESGGYPDGLRLMDGNSHASTSDGIGSANGLWDFTLPESSAYLWPKTQVLDLNLHIKNTSPSTVLGVDLYVNVYTQPIGIADKYMLIRNFIDDQIAIPPGNQITHFWGEAYDENETRMWDIWTLYTHTHQYGLDFDLWLRNPDGTMGEQVYEGFYDKEYTFNQGFYSTGVDVAIRKFEPELFEVDPRLGFIYHAQYRNTSADTVFWGFNSDEEMLAVGFQYTYGDSLGPLPTGMDDEEPVSDDELHVFPNPAKESLVVNFSVQQSAVVTLEMTNMLGETYTIYQEQKAPGKYVQPVYLPRHFSSGVYELTLRNGAVINSTKRIAIQ